MIVLAILAGITLIAVTLWAMWCKAIAYAEEQDDI